MNVCSAINYFAGLNRDIDIHDAYAAIAREVSEIDTMAIFGGMNHEEVGEMKEDITISAGECSAEKREKKETVDTHIHIPTDLYEAAKVWAKRDGRKISSYIIEAVKMRCAHDRYSQEKWLHEFSDTEE